MAGRVTSDGDGPKKKNYTSFDRNTKTSQFRIVSLSSDLSGKKSIEFYVCAGYQTEVNL